MLAGYFMQVAHLERTGHYLTVKDNQVRATFNLLHLKCLICFVAPNNMFPQSVFDGIIFPNRSFTCTLQIAWIISPSGLSTMSMS